MMIENVTERKTIQDYIEAIENGDIYLDAVLANPPHALLTRLAQNPVVQEIQRRLSDGDLQDALYARAIFLLREPPVPEGHASPNDLPLVGYLFLLGEMPEPRERALLQAVVATERRDLRSARFVASERIRRNEENQAVREAFLPATKLVRAVNEPPHTYSARQPKVSASKILNGC